MPKTKISEFSATPANNTDIDSINIAEGCAPSGINDAIRELMAQLKDFQTGAVGDSFNGPVGTSTAAAGAFTTLSSTGNTTLGDASGDSVTINGTATFANANPTLTAGTANGVTYLNGSKVLTSGSALQFTGSNLSIGIAASANEFGNNLQINQTILNDDNAGTNHLTKNAYYSSGWKYISTDYASKYTQSLGTHQWSTAPSGTAGNAVTFTEGMRLTSTGLGIKTSTPITPLTVQANSGGDATSLIGRSTGQNEAWLLWYKNGGSVTNAGILGDNQGLKFGIGSALTEAARFDTSGNLLVGSTSYVYPLSVSKTTTNSRVGYLRADTSSYTDSVLILDTTTTAGTSCRFIEGYSGSSSLQFRVYNNGNVQNTNNSYGSISDAKLKENIVDATPKLADLMQVQVRNYNLIGETTKQIGVVAQELETVFPAMVDESPDRDAEGNDLGTTTKAVKYSVFVPMLIKAIQEQQALITQLQADIATLKG